MSAWQARKPARDTFAYFRKAWGPRAAYHLTRCRLGADWRDRWLSALWCIAESVPLSGAAPSMGLPGLPLHRYPLPWK
jgi:hypothetical protein